MMESIRLLSPLGHQTLVSLQNRETRSEVTASLKALAELPAPIAAETMRRIFALETKIFAVVQNDKRWFFSQPDDPEIDMFARDLAVLHTTAAKSFATLIERRGEWSLSDKDPLLVRTIAFALHHHDAAIKWGFFRHDAVKATSWPQLHRLFKLAETLEIAYLPIQLFDREDSAPTSVAALYTRALLIDLLNTGSLSAPQIEIADKWLAAWTPRYHFDATYEKDVHALYVDLESISGLHLVSSESSPDSFRFLRLTGIEAQLETTRNELRAGRPFLGHGSPNLFPMEEHVALLAVIERLNANILHSSARRIEERKVLADSYAEVQVGFSAAHAVVVNKDASMAEEKANAPAELSFGGVTLSLEPRADGAAEAATLETPEKDRRTPWRVHDVTSKGMGLFVSRALGDRLQVGQLLAVRRTPTDRWMLAAIARKMEHRSAGETLLGVEVLSHVPLPISLQATDDFGDPLDMEPLKAIYLAGEDTNGRTDMIVVEGGGSGLKHIFTTRTKRGSFDLRLNRVLRKGNDWIGLRFEVVSQHEV